jgi:cysteine synthase
LAAVMVIRDPAVYARVKQLRDLGDYHYLNTKIVKGFGDDGKPNCDWLTASHPVITGFTDKNGNHYLIGKLVKGDVVWFFDNQGHADAIKEYFDAYAWTAVGIQVATVAVSAGTSGLGAGVALPGTPAVATVTDDAAASLNALRSKPLTEAEIKSLGSAYAEDLNFKLGTNNVANEYYKIFRSRGYSAEEAFEMAKKASPNGGTGIGVNTGP